MLKCLGRSCAECTGARLIVVVNVRKERPFRWTYAPLTSARVRTRVNRPAVAPERHRRGPGARDEGLEDGDIRTPPIGTRRRGGGVQRRGCGMHHNAP